jgi:hypothetical protein
MLPLRDRDRWRPAGTVINAGTLGNQLFEALGTQGRFAWL